jgi:hypothetical protein
MRNIISAGGGCSGGGGGSNYLTRVCKRIESTLSGDSSRGSAMDYIVVFDLLLLAKCIRPLVAIDW